MSKQSIELKGIRVHNLKNINLNIKLNQFVVITGVSGSGKSSLAFDTLYAEGQRRYVESLSSYARQFLGRLNKPECDYIKGIPPAVAIEQKVNTSNPRSTVGTSTELYDYIKLLYARIGKTYSPISGEEVKRHSVDDIYSYILEGHTDQTVVIMAKLAETTNENLPLLISQGFSRIKYGDEFIRISDLIEKNIPVDSSKEMFLVIDRTRINDEKDTVSRIKDSVETALYEGNGTCYIDIDGVTRSFSNKFEADGIEFQIPTINTFSFNSPIGACPKCEGYGKILGIDEDLVVPNKSLSVYDDAVMCWRGEKMSEWKHFFVQHAHKINFPVHTPYFELTAKEKDLLWNSENGIYAFFEYLESKKFKIQNRVMIARYTGKTKCPVCQGTRLKKEATYVKINNHSITELVDMPISELKVYFDNLQLSEHDKTIAARVLPDIHNRIDFLLDVGLGYLTLNRLSSSLSGGESQRINLATSLGSALVGSLYILDEPSIGLHSRDTDRLIQVLQRLRDIGNTVVVVEHDEDTMRAADFIVDIGPGAGVHGGEVICAGTLDDIMKCERSITGQYLTGKLKIEVPEKRRKPTKKWLKITGCRENNLKNITVKVPLGIFTCITGVSGSGKSSLVNEIIYKHLVAKLNRARIKPGAFDTFEGTEYLDKVIAIDQSPIGRTPRSNPATYTGVFNDIRELFASTNDAKMRGYTSGRFSFNVKGGRCEACEGDGINKIEMHFLPDIYVPCEVCKGKRYNRETLEVHYRGKNIYDVLEMTVEEGIAFFENHEKIKRKLQTLYDVGLGYVKIGQPATTLSGGEAQRVKLASELSKRATGKTVYILDEPTTGLHTADGHKLIDVLQKLTDGGNTVLVIEHNLDVIKTADYIIDMGPEGGSGGGTVIATGTPEEVAANPVSYTGRYLAQMLGIERTEQTTLE